MSPRKISTAPGWQVLAGRMASGEAYTMRGLYKLAPEYAPKSIRAYVYRFLLPRNLVTRHRVEGGRHKAPRFRYQIATFDEASC